jgi:Holliday junction resolvase-like predicted endonuclease
MESSHETAQKNYDGYYFGYVHMFCPWDVMSFCKENYEKVGRNDNEITAGNYWINTSGNDIIEEFMGFIGPEDIKKMQSLMDGESIEVEVRETLCYGDLKNHDINDFWTLLLYTGYLTFNPQYISEEEDVCSVHIPNEEIRKCFKSKILNFYKKNTVMKNRTDDLIKGLFTGDAELIETSLCSLLAKYVSIRDFSTRAPKENYYHGFMNGLLVNGASLIQEQKSNFESGNGYVDLIIKSQKNSESKGIIAIIELKQTSDENDDKVLIADSAIEQIINKKYADAYIKRNDIREVYIYGICFYAKECSVVVKKLK